MYFHKMRLESGSWINYYGAQSLSTSGFVEVNVCLRFVRCFLSIVVLLFYDGYYFGQSVIDKHSPDHDGQDIERRERIAYNQDSKQ